MRGATAPWGQAWRVAVGGAEPWRPYLAAGAGLAWPWAGPAVWSAVTHRLPPPVAFFAVSAAVWLVAWTVVAGLAAPSGFLEGPAAPGPSPGAWARSAVGARWRAGARHLPAGALAAATTAAGWATLWWVPSLAAGLPVPRAALAVVAAGGGVALLTLVLAVLGARAGHGGTTGAAIVRELRARFPACAAAAVAWAGAAWLGRAYLWLFVPPLGARAWAWWALDGLLSALALRWVVAAAPARRSTPPAAGPAERPAGPAAPETGDRPTPAPPASGRAPGAGLPPAAVGPLAGWLLAVVAFALLRPAVVAGAAGVPAARADLRAAAARLAAGDPEGAARAARAAVALGLGQWGVALAARGDATAAAQAGAAAERLDPLVAAGYEAAGLGAVGTGRPASALTAVEALLHLGDPGAAFDLLSQACASPALAGAGHPARCAGEAALMATWRDPALALTGPVVRAPGASPPAGGPPPRAVPPGPTVDAGVVLWSAALERQSLGGVMPAAMALARAYVLFDALAGLPRLPPAPARALGLALVAAGSGTADAGAIADGVGLIPAPAPGVALDPASAGTLLAAGIAFGVMGPDRNAGAQAIPLPAALVTAALEAAAEPSAPPALVREAGVFCLLEASGNQATMEHRALRFLRRALAADASQADLWADAALAEYELADYPAASADARRAVALAPSAQAEIVLGDSLFGEANAAGVLPAQSAQDLAQAAAALRAGLALDPSPFLAWMALGDVLAAEHRPAEALVAYRSALAAYADDQANHVDTFSAPQEGFAMTGLPWNNAGYAVILAHIRAAEQEQNGNGS